MFPRYLIPSLVNICTNSGTFLRESWIPKPQIARTLDRIESRYTTGEENSRGNRDEILVDPGCGQQAH